MAMLCRAGDMVMKRRLLSRILLLIIMVCTSGSFGADFEIGRKALNKGDYAVALKEWYPLAEQGDSRAQTFLGLMYTNGIGVPRNDAEAVRWFLLAANKGYAQAQYNLGLMYALGLSVSQDNTEAVKWYRLAAVQGYVKAETALKITASKLAQQNKLKALKAKEEARLKAEKVARFKAKEKTRLKVEEVARLKARKVARLKAEEEARLKAEKVARLKTEEEAQLKAEEEARLKADKVAQRKAKKKAQLRAMEEKRLATIEEGKRLEGALTKQDKRFILIGLKKSGFQTIDVDGVFGAETRKTIRAYQLSLNQDASGFLNADQLASLRSIGQSAEEARSPKKEPSTGEGFTLFGIKIIPLND